MLPLVHLSLKTLFGSQLPKEFPLPHIPISSPKTVEYSISKETFCKFND